MKKIYPLSLVADYKEEEPWRPDRPDLPKDERCEKIITKKSMIEYYSKFVEEVDDEEKNLIKKIEESPEILAKQQAEKRVSELVNFSLRYLDGEHKKFQYTLYRSEYFCQVLKRIKALSDWIEIMNYTRN